MDLRRYILFIVLATTILFGWNTYVLPIFFPPQAAQDVADNEGGGDAAPEGGADENGKTEAGEAQAGKTEDSDTPPDKQGGDQPKDGGPDKADPDEVGPGKADPDKADPDKPKNAESTEIAEFETRTIELGSNDPNSGYFLNILVSSRGAVVESVWFNDPRYVEIDDRKEPLQMIGRETGSDIASFATRVEPIESQLEELNLDGTEFRNWEVIETIKDEIDTNINTGVVLSLTSPDGTVEVQKTIRIDRVDVEGQTNEVVRDSASDGYLLHVDLKIINKGDSAFSPYYIMQGPVGLPLDNKENTRKFREFKIGILEESGGIETLAMTSSDLVDADDDDEVEFWRDPIGFAGIDMQYFSVLVIPAENQLEKTYTDSVRPLLIERATTEAWSEIGVQLESTAVELDAGDELEHKYLVYIGPRRERLLAPIAQTGEHAVSVQAEQVLDYGMFWSVASGMLWLLNTLHGFGIPYGIAIICLTIVVRGCMFPLSRKQALNAQKMKDLQPKIQELKKKYGKDKEKFAKAQMELFQKNNFNPLAGCLPLIVQLPIFISLYTALGNSVDLRMAPFLYIDDLSSPDRLIPNWLGGMSLPFLGPDLNLLPLITMVLFQVQQKLYMPPPSNDQEAAQQKMMSFMMIIFGVFFYKVPAGLCVYFIASSSWGMAERKLLGKTKPAKKAEGESEVSLKPA